jgi:ATP-dependent exoDNAse (exonuclease V) alpha subunit
MIDLTTTQNGFIMNEQEYIIIDEISMVPDIFYKYLCIIKKFRPDIQFIIAGDFAQLQPVKDRVGDFNYKNSFLKCDNVILWSNWRTWLPIPLYIYRTRIYSIRLEF